MARSNGNTAIEKVAPDQVQVRERRPEQRRQQNQFTFTPAIDVWDNGQEWLLYADIPGADPEKINITCEDGTLTLHASVPARWPAQGSLRSGEYNIGDYFRTFRIGEDIEVDKISAEYTSGVLTLHLPRIPRAQARRVPIMTK